MRFDAGQTDVPTAGTRVQFYNTNDKVLWARFKAKSTNAGLAYVGVSDVSATDGFALLSTDTVGLELDFRAKGGSILASTFYFDVATNGDDIQWALIIE